MAEATSRSPTSPGRARAAASSPTAPAATSATTKSWSACWYNDKNFARRDRAIELAKQLGQNPIHVALAFVLAQPFPSIPLIGPRTLGELDDSLKAFDIKLTPEQVAWLDNG